MHTHPIRKQPITLRSGKLTTIGLEPEFFRALRLIAYSRAKITAIIAIALRMSTVRRRREFSGQRLCLEYHWHRA
jgi:hypothetical protein